MHSGNNHAGEKSQRSDETVINSLANLQAVDEQVVGLVFEPVDQESAITPRRTLVQEIGQVGRGKSIKVQTVHGDAATEAEVAAELRAELVINVLAQVMNLELVYRVSAPGFLVWLGIVTILAMIASWFPARKAAQTSVRQSLAYI